MHLHHQLFKLRPIFCKVQIFIIYNTGMSSILASRLLWKHELFYNFFFFFLTCLRTLCLACISGIKELFGIQPVLLLPQFSFFRKRLNTCIFVPTFTKSKCFSIIYSKRIAIIIAFMVCFSPSTGTV